MALKDIVKGICETTRCKYDVYTKEKSDELLAEKQNKMTVDTTPTENSSNPVGSGGVFKALSEKANASNFAILTGTMTQTGTQTIEKDIEYPEGFNKNNCIVVSSMLDMVTETNEEKWSYGSAMDNYSMLAGCLLKRVTLYDDTIRIQGRSITVSNSHEVVAQAISNDYMYKVVLMKID